MVFARFEKQMWRRKEEKRDCSVEQRLWTRGIVWNDRRSFLPNRPIVTRVNETWCSCAKEKKKKRWKRGNYVFDRHVRIYEPEAARFSGRRRRRAHQNSAFAAQKNSGSRCKSRYSLLQRAGSSTGWVTKKETNQKFVRFIHEKRNEEKEIS